MSAFTISASELDEISKIFVKRKLSGLVRTVDYSLKHNINSHKQSVNSYSLDSLSIFTNKYLLNNTDALKDIYEYTKNKSCNIAHFLENKMITSYSNADTLDGYARLIKNTDHYLNNSENIYKVIVKKTPSTLKNFWSIVTLASCIHDINLSIKAFYLILKEKKSSIYSFSLLDLEKIKRAFDKRFKNLNEKDFPKVEYQFILKSFTEIDNSKTKSFCTTTSGSYLDVFIDIDLICQENKFSKNKNNGMLKSLFNNFASCLADKKDKPLSLNKIIVRDEDDRTLSFHVVFYFEDVLQGELIRLVVGDLIDYAIIKDKDGKLQGESIKNKNSEQFFSSFIMNHAFEKTLDKKEETKIKKNKI
jgi:hypothetical protein